MKVHKHKDLIIAWAEGSKIQIHSHGDVWIDHEEPRWLDCEQYRIKPEPKNDFEKYEVRIGDVWTNNQGSKFVVIGIENNRAFIGGVAVEISNGSKVSLSTFNKMKLIYRYCVIDLIKLVDVTI